MNRRDFLGFFRGLAVLPFIKPLSLKATERTPRHPFTIKAVNITRSDSISPYQVQPGQRVKLVDTGQIVSGGEFTSGQAVFVSGDAGALEVWDGTGQIIGIAARDIAPGEIVEWRIGGNSKDIITKTS